MIDNFPLDGISLGRDDTAYSAMPSTSPIDPHLLASLLGNATKTGVVICDKDSRILCFNPLAQKLMDIPADFFQLGRLSTDMIQFMARQNDSLYKVEAEKLTQNLGTLINHARNGTEFRESWTFTQGCGREVFIENVSSPEGYIIHLLSEHAPQDKLHDTALRLGHAGYWSMNFKQGTINISEQLRHIFTDVEHAQCLKKGFWSVLHPEEVERVQEIWADGIRSKQTFNFSYRVILEKTGIAYFQTIVEPTYSETGKPLSVTCFVSDVTQHHLALNEMRDDKERAEKVLQGNNEFLARMSHEIRTPMNGILGMTDALLFSEEFQNATEQLSVIKESAKNLLRILDDTLEHARLSARKIKIMPENHDPRNLLKTLVTLWETKAQNNGTSLTLHMDPKLPNMINFDRFRLEQCMNNLLSNAVKFTKNGKIQIVATFVEQPGKTANFILAVKDSGIGMSADQQSRVFTPFEQADESISLRFGGTGLGMPICKDIVELMGGKITLKSELGQGSTFILSMPCAEFGRFDPHPLFEHEQHTTQTNLSPVPLAGLDPTHAFRVSPPPEETTENTPPAHSAEHDSNIGQSVPLDIALPADQTAEAKTAEIPNIFKTSDHSNQTDTFTPALEDDPMARYKSLRILVVEDNETNQVVIKALLSPIVDEIFFAMNGKDGLETLKSNRVDLVLMDIHMPIMDGIEATLAIRASNTEWSDIGIIALTADPEYQQKRICRNIGMNSAISKPVSRGDLLQAFDEVLDELGECSTRLTA